MILALCMVIAPSTVQLMANASGVPVISATNVTATAGQSVEVVFTIAQNPGLALIGIDVTWDNRLTNVSVSITGSSFPITAVVPPAAGQAANLQRVNFLSIMGDNHANETLFTVTATVPAQAAPGTTFPITITVPEINNFALDLNPVPTINNGAITVPGGGATQPPEIDCDYCNDEGCNECEPLYDCDYCSDEGCDECDTSTDNDNDNNQQNNNQNNNQQQPGPGTSSGGTTPPPQSPVTPGTQLPPYLPDSGPGPDIDPDNISDPEPPEETEAVDEARLPQRVVRFEIDSVVYIVNRVHFTNDVAPFIDSVYNRTMIPLRAASEALGAEVEWICATRTVQIFTAAGMQTLAVDVSLPDGMGNPVIVQDRVFVPLYFVARILGVQVRWDGANRAAYVYM